MSELFLKIVNMSISASWVVIAVLTLRFCLKKAPKWVNVLLWGIVAVRMVFPFSIESVLSLIPSAETISPSIMMEQSPSVQTGVPALNHVINPVISGSFTPAPGASANPLQIWIRNTSIWMRPQDWMSMSGRWLRTVITLACFRIRHLQETALHRNCWRFAVQVVSKCGTSLPRMHSIRMISMSFRGKILFPAISRSAGLSLKTEKVWRKNRRST